MTQAIQPTFAVSQPADGSLQLESSGAFTYAPDANFVGQDSFEFEVSDGVQTPNGVQETVATAYINVNDTAPEVTNPTYDVLAGVSLYVGLSDGDKKRGRESLLLTIVS
jgi:hypothetical protein